MEGGLSQARVWKVRGADQSPVQQVRTKVAEYRPQRSYMGGEKLNTQMYILETT